MEPFLVEYLANSIWQVPLLAAGAWLTLRILRPNPSIQHRVWLATFALMLTMPLLTHRASPTPIVPSPAPATVASIEDIPDDTLAPTTALNLQSADQTPAPIPAPQPLLQSPAETATPSRHQLHEVTLTSLATHWLIGLYLAVVAFMATRLLSSAWASRRLIAHAKPALLSHAASDQLNLCCELFDIARPRILTSAQIASPMVVGTIQPALLLPQSFAARLEDPATQPTREIEAVWLHELAHLRRRDHLINLVCRIAALPIAYHPATQAVQQRIRQTREMVCDELAATAMQSPLSYARCLVGLALTMHGMTPRIEAVGMFDNTVLEERIMQLTKTKTILSAPARALRLAGGTSLMLAILTAPAIFHVTPTVAQTPTSAPPAAVVPPASAASMPAPAPQPSDQPHPAPKVRAQPSPTPEAAEAKTKQAEAQAADAESKAATAEANAQFEEARKRLDEAARAYTDLATKSADTTAQTAEARQQLDDARRQLAEANRAWNQQIVKTVDKAIRDQQFKINDAEMKARMAELQARLNSPEFKAQMDKFNSPEFKKQMADMQAKFNSPDWKEKTEKFAGESARLQAKFSSPEWKAQMDKLNSPEFRKQLQENSEMTRQMNILNDDLARQMDKVSRQIDEALRLWNANAPTQ